jgi:hypothetical protein
MTTPDPAGTPPVKQTTAVVRVGRIFLGIIAVLFVAAAIFGKRPSESTKADTAPAQVVSPATSTATSTPATTPTRPLTTQDRIALAEAEVARREKVVERLVADLWEKVDASGEGIETKGEIQLIVHNLQEGQEEIAFTVLERSTKVRVRLLRKDFIGIRDAQRLVAAANEERGVLLRKRLDEKREEAEADRAAQSRAVGVQGPAAPPTPAPTTPAP